MQTIADLVADARERDATLFANPDGPADHSYETFSTTVWKAGNLLRHYGVRLGDSVAVAVGPAASEPDDESGHVGTSPTPLLAVLGGIVSGASVTLDPVAAVEAKALVAPTAWLDRFTPGPGTKPIGYGDEVTEPTVAQFERETWSENPVEPPVELDPMVTAVGGTDPFTHGDLLMEVRRLDAELGLEAGDRVGVAGQLDAGAVVAGVLLPMVVGATITLSPAADSALDLFVGSESEAPSDVPWIDPADVLAG